MSRLAKYYRLHGKHENIIDLALRQLAYEESLPILRVGDDHLTLIKVLRLFGQSLTVLGQWERGVSIVNESVELSYQAEDETEIAWSLNDLGQVHFFHQDYDQACHLFEESLSIHRRISNTNGQMWALLSLGKIALHGYHNFPLARQMLDQAVFKSWDSYILLNPELAFAEGDYRHSRGMLEEVLKDALAYEYMDLIAGSHYWLGWHEWRTGKLA